MNLPGVVTLIRFGCAIRLPTEGRFLFQEDFEADPQLFLKRWLEGAVSNIYTGPKVNRRDNHDGHLMIVPEVKVRYLNPNHHFDTPEQSKRLYGAGNVRREAL